MPFEFYALKPLYVFAALILASYISLIYDREGTRKKTPRRWGFSIDVSAGQRARS
jgi:hypothetical protein